MEHLIEHKFSIFISLYLFLSFAEFYAPVRSTNAHFKRISNNWLLGIVNTFCIFLFSLIVPFLLMGVAYWVEITGFGFLNLVNIGSIIELVIALFVLDLVIWFQHMFTHRNQFLWKFHRVHHTDKELDVSTGIRFHPVEIMFSFLVKVIAIILIGASPLAVLIFEILLSSFALLTHSNVNFGKNTELKLNRIIVTPRMHLIHHAPCRQLHDNNYGFCLSIWDRMFRTYIPVNSDPDDRIGLFGFGDKDLSFKRLMSLPFEDRS